MKTITISIFLTFCSLLVFGQELVKDSTYLQAVNDSTFLMVNIKTYSNGAIQTSSNPVTPSEVVTNFQSFLEFRAREYQYAATSSYDLNRKITLVNNANENLKNSANIDMLANFAEKYHSELTGNYTLNGDDVTISYTNNELKWNKNGSNGDIVVYSNTMIALKSYINSKDILLYKLNEKWVNCDGIFVMEKIKYQ